MIDEELAWGARWCGLRLQCAQRSSGQEQTHQPSVKPRCRIRNFRFGLLDRFRIAEPWLRRNGSGTTAARRQPCAARRWSMKLPHNDSMLELHRPLELAGLNRK